MSSSSPQLSSEHSPPSILSGNLGTRAVLLPYALAMVAQLPMLLLYFRGLWCKSHYQSFGVGLVAVLGITLLRWPFRHDRVFFRNPFSDVLLVWALLMALLGMLFVEPWFAACSFMLLVTSLLARTLDLENRSSLWPCAIPMFVYLALPDGSDFQLITKLQYVSAVYTSRLLDLLGLGHHMDGTVIKIPSLRDYGIEQACSGVQSFFTLVFVATVFVVLGRRVHSPRLLFSVISLACGAAVYLIGSLLGAGLGFEICLLASVGLILFGLMGFRAATLILSAFFWAVFMNTIRITVIPLAEYFLKWDLSGGVSHQVLGYVALFLGVLLLFSTDQFMLFLFGPVDDVNQEPGPVGRFITGFWNKLIPGKRLSERRQRRLADLPFMQASSQKFLWSIAILMLMVGLWQLYDVRSSLSAREDFQVRFFDRDPTVNFEASDMPEKLGQWVQVSHESEGRSIGSDLGQRSDTWRYHSQKFAAVFSLDQPFPGWHELTTCYKNTGWRLLKRQMRLPSEFAELDGDVAESEWGYIEAVFEKNTGEKAYLLFSHFDAFGEGLPAPQEWGTLNSFFLRARNRLSHRIRSSLFHGEAYQTQILVSSFNDLPDHVKQEINLKYLKMRGHILKQFTERQRSLAQETEVAQN